MPFEAAKAVAATFCYNIRYALTPVFGLDFLSLCVNPEDPSFGRMVIDRDIVRQCTETANGLRVLSRAASKTLSPKTPSSSAWSQRPSKSLRPKPVKILGMENGYDTDTDRSERHFSSPQTPISLEWTALNTIRPTQSPYHSSASPPRLKNTSTSKYSDSKSSSDSEEIRGIKRALPKKDDKHEKDEKDDEESLSNNTSEEGAAPLKRRKRTILLTTETKAAYLLMQLHMKDATLGKAKGRRRASS